MVGFEWWGWPEYAILRRMRPLRDFKPNRCYHLVSRIANRAFFLTGEERSRFVDRLWRVARFSGVEVLTYCFMSDHFHLLVYVPEAPELDDGELLARIAALYSGTRLAEVRKEWDLYVRLHDEARKEAFRQRFFRRMYDVSAFMKTLKQNATMSYNCRREHAGTMWEARFRAREYLPDEKCALMNVAAYIDRNPVKAKMARWPSEYEWCSFAAACRGDRRSIDGYRFVYTFAPLTWDQIREMHERSIHLVLKELGDERLSGPARQGLSVDEERRQKARQKLFARLEQDLPRRVPHLLERGRDKVAADLLGLLAEGPKRPAELRAALGISSANFFTSCYLTPLARMGLVADDGGERGRFSPAKRYRLTGRGARLAAAQPHHSNPTIGV